MARCNCSRKSLQGRAESLARITVARAMAKAVSDARKKHVAKAKPHRLDSEETGRSEVSAHLISERVPSLPESEEVIGREAAMNLVTFIHSDEGLDLIETARLII